MLKLIQEIVYQVTGKKGLALDTDLVKDLALNSFDIMNIISRFEDYYDTTIPTRDVWKIHTVQDVIDYLARRGFSRP